MGNVGFPELIVIFIVALIVFGPRKLPELGRTLGKALAEFRKASTDLRLAVEGEMRELERQTQELESKVSEAVSPIEEPAALPEGPVGSGPIDPQLGAPPQPEPAASESPRPEEKPADGEPKPA